MDAAVLSVEQGENGPLGDEDLERAARRITRTLFLAQSAGSAGVIAAATINPIVAAELGGSSNWAGVPSAMFLLGGAAGAYLCGALMDVLGRRLGLAVCLVLGVAGAALAGWSVVAGALAPYLVGMAMIGAGSSSLQLARFTAAEVHPPQQRGRAISSVVMGGAVGSILGPLLVGPMGRLAEQAGFDELVGPFPATFGLFIVCWVLVLVGLRPDPRSLALEIARRYPDAAPQVAAARRLGEILRQPRVLLAIGTMVLSQVVMVMLMVITALHMRGHQHALSSVALVISSHTFGMFAFSIISGRLADSWGRLPVILTGAGVLGMAAFLVTLSPEVLPLAVGLFFLGLGWNFCYVGGSSFLADQLAPAERSRTQGFNDLLIGTVSAIGSLASGLVFSQLGYNTVAYVSMALAFGLAGLVLWGWVVRSRRVGPASPHSEAAD